MSDTEDDLIMRLEKFIMELDSMLYSNQNESMLAVKAVDWNDDHRLSDRALAKIRDLCRQFAGSHPRYFVMEDDVTLLQKLGICNRKANEIYLLHEESVPGDYPSECGFAITDEGICVKEFREKWTRIIPYDELLSKKIDSTLAYQICADDILLAQYMCIDSIFVVSKLVDLFIRIQNIVQQEYVSGVRDDSAKVVRFRDCKKKETLHTEWQEALQHSGLKISSWFFDDEEEDDEEDEDDDEDDDV